MLSHRLWRERYGADLDIIGREIRLDSTPYTVIGVLPPGAHDRHPAELWIPLAFTPEQINHDVRWLAVKGRLKEGVTRQEAQQELNIIADDLARRFPQSNKGWGVTVQPLQNNFLPETARVSLWLLLAAVSFVVLIACVNVANLLLARWTTRTRETAIRVALGASHARVFRHVLTESLVLAAAGGAFGVLLSVWMLQGIVAVLPFRLPAEADPRLSLPVLIFTVLATTVSGVLFGSAPAWQAGRVDVNETLKQSGRTAIAGGGRGLRHALVVVECALAITLLAGAGLTIYSFWKRTQVDLGVARENVLTFSLPVPDERLETAERIRGFYNQLLERLVAVPGVRHASVSIGLPVRGGTPGMPFTIVGRSAGDEGAPRVAGFQMITPDYLETFGIRLLGGRQFTNHDSASTPRVALVNERFVDVFFEDSTPLRQRLLIDELVPGVEQLGEPVEWQIVGVVSDVNNGGPLGERAAPHIYVPFSQSPWPQTAVAVRTATDPATIQQGLAAVVRSLDPELPMVDVRTLEQIVDEQLAPDRLDIALYSGLAAVALLLAALGIYGVMSFSVAQRTSEIGLRMALGAGRADVLWRIMREGLVLAAGGLLLGFAGAYALGRAMQSILFGTGALSLPIVLVAGLVLLGAALAACYVPARRASVVDPMIALRQE